ncbi:hypothetical protein PN836_009795 [Ningiella sp. W23]|uniref:hypothetical protein n=1 Tax=Ningiella sp. W23 TaxID=3023715 RepID=UPI003756C66D
MDALQRCIRISFVLLITSFPVSASTNNVESLTINLGAEVMQIVESTNFNEDVGVFGFSASTSDNNYIANVYLYFSGDDSIRHVTSTATGMSSAHRSYNLQLSPSGKYLYFLSSANDLTDVDIDSPQLFVYDIEADLLSLVVNKSGERLNEPVDWLHSSFANDSEEIFFASSATNATLDTTSRSRSLFKFNPELNDISLVFRDFDYRNVSISSNNDTGVAEITEYSGYCASDLFLFSITNSTVERLNLKVHDGVTDDCVRDETGIISNDGSKVALTSQSDNSFQIFEIESEKVELIEKPDVLSGTRLELRQFDQTSGDIILEYNSYRGIERGLYRFNIVDKHLQFLAVDNNSERLSWVGFGNNRAFPSSGSKKLLYFGKNNTRISGTVYLSNPDNLGIPIPAAPVGLSITNNRVASVRLDWNSDSDDTYIYTIARRASGETDYTLVDTTYNTHYVDASETLETSELYSYKIGACNAAIECGFSTADGGQVLAPEKVVGVSTSIITNGDYIVSWTPVDDVDTYKISYLRDFEEHEEFASASHPQFRYRSYQSSKPALLKVSACKNGLCGPFSDPMVIAPRGRDIVALRGLSYFIESGGRYRLSWRPQDYAVYYEVFSSDSTTDLNNLIFRRKVYKNEFFDTVVDISRPVRYQVRACYENDNCGNFSSLTTSPIFDESFQNIIRPQISVNAAPGFNSISLNHGKNYEAYSLYRRVSRFSDGELIASFNVGIGEDFEFQDETILPDVEYFYYVEACINDRCKRSADESVRSLDDFLSNIGRVISLSATNGDFSNVVKLTWTIEGIADKIKIFRDGKFLAAVNTGSGEYIDTEIVQGLEHLYTIVPQLSTHGETFDGKMSSSAIGSTNFIGGSAYELAPPLPSTNLERFFDKILITWPHVPGTTEYLVETSSFIDGTFTEHSNTSNNYLFIRNLAPGVELFFRIKSCVNTYCGYFSSVFRGASSDVYTVPENFSDITDISTQSDGSIAVEFSTVSDATYYQIIRRESLFDSYSSEFEVHESPFIDTNASDFRDYYYAVAACNASGCSSRSTYQMITTGGKEATYDTTNEYYIQYVGVDEASIDLSVQYSARAPYPERFEIYRSSSSNSEKELIHTERFPGGSESIAIGGDIASVGDYLWIQTCFQDGTCVMSRHYSIINAPEPPEISAPIPSAPIVSGGVAAFNVLSHWVPDNTHLRVYYSKTREGEKVYVGRITNNRSNSPRFDVDGFPYSQDIVYVWQTQCFRGECSDFSSATEVNIHPDHANSISINSTELWNGIDVFNPNGHEFKQNITTMQFMNFASGGKFTGDITVSSTESCEVMSIALQLSGIYESLPIFRVVRGGDCNGYLGLSDRSKFYVIAANDIEEAVPIPVNDINEQTVGFSVDIDSEYNVKVNVAGNLTETYSYSSLKVFRPEFAKITVEPGSRRASTINSFEYIASSVFNESRPNPPEGYASDWGNVINSYVYHYELEGAVIRRRYFKEVSDGVWVLEATLLTTNHSEEYYPESTGTYLVDVSVCNEECSSSIFDSVYISQNITRPSAMTLSQVGATSSVRVGWSAVTEATYYLIRYGDWNSFKEVSSTDLSVTLENITETSLDVSVRACNESICSSTRSRTISMSLDSDGDGLFDAEERQIGSDPFIMDTDGDGLSDFDEVRTHRTSALDADTDRDGIDDALEIEAGRDPLANDGCIGYMCGSKLRGWKFAELVQ